MNTDLARHLKDFFQSYLLEQRSLSPNTIRSYRDTFKLLIQFMTGKQDASRLPKVQDLDVKVILAFLQHLEDPQTGRGNSAHTRNQRLAAIQCFFKYLSLHYPSFERQGKKISAIPVKRASSPRVLESLDRRELEVLLSQPKTDTADGIRDLAILLYLYNTGARAQEAADARLSWFDFTQRMVEITGKGRKRRKTPLWPSTVRLLKLYAEQYRRKSAGVSDYFFVSRLGQPFTRFGIRAVVKRYIRQAAKRCPSLNTKRLSTHSLRHTIAGHLLESDVEPNAIKAWLGHASIESTGRYLDTDLNRKRRILEQFGPPNYVTYLDNPENVTSKGEILGWLRDL